MRIWKAIFSVLTIISGSIGLMGIVSPDITLPIMFVFMGLALLTNAKEHYDKGAKKDAMLFAGLAIFVFIITAYNLISRFM
jgi:apolipoprotein N-acyltransferase